MWYLGLTGVVLAFSYRDRGLWRVTGILVIVAYVAFAGMIAGLAYHQPGTTRIAVVAGLAVAAVSAAHLAVGRLPGARSHKPGPPPVRPASRNVSAQVPGKPVEVSANGSSPHGARAPVARPSQRRLRQQSLLAGWPVNKLWILGLAISLLVAAVDGALGNRITLIGLLIAGPCCVALTGRWVPTALTGLWATALAVALGIPDGIWGTAIHFTWLGAVAAVSLASTLAAAFLQTAGPARLR